MTTIPVGVFVCSLKPVAISGGYGKEIFFVSAASPIVAVAGRSSFESSSHSILCGVLIMFM